MGYSITSGSDRRSKQFITSLVIALLVHMALVGAWKIVPVPASEELPVKMLSVKLGNALSGRERRLIEEAQAPRRNVEMIEHYVSTQVTTPTVDAEGVLGAQTLTKAGAAKAKSKSAPKAVVDGKAKSRGQVAKRFVRKRVSVKPEAEVAGAALGNKKWSPQQMVAGYTQTISLWMNKFKVYPDEARDAGMQGQAVVRIRIDRQGNIHYRILSQETPYPILNKAALDMVRRANPVPPVPSDYPDKAAFLEYMIPVNFKLD